MSSKKSSQNRPSKPLTQAQEQAQKEPQLLFSVIIASYNRKESLLHLLGDLEKQTLGPSMFEVVLVDDGSAVPVASFLEIRKYPFALHIERQKNGGASAARERGAELAKGEFLLFLDDDMQIPPPFLESHQKEHGGKTNRVVLGRLRASESISEMPLFEQFYAQILDKMNDQIQAGTRKLDGSYLYTGNLSLSRSLFFQAGGFDKSFLQIEDAELGIRLGKLGAEFIMSEEAYSIHASDHIDEQKWLARSKKDGRFWSKLAHKHGQLPHASPWRHLRSVNPISRPFLIATAILPEWGGKFSKTAFSAAKMADRAGLKKLAIAGTTLVYGLQYIQGAREETGTFAHFIAEYIEFHQALKELGDPEKEGYTKLLHDIRKDHAFLVSTQEKYKSGSSHGSDREILSDFVNNIGFQMVVMYRLMRACYINNFVLGAKFVSRLMRHLYSSDIHWEAQLEPGVVFVHGFGMAISSKAYVSEGCILFQHVTLGVSAHPQTRQSGAPKLERNVHVGAGATLVGPITVGENSKIMANLMLREDVPANSLVEAPEVKIRGREK